MGEDGIARTEWGSSVQMLTPEACPGLVYYLPTPKIPHGVDVDPTGEFIVAGGKLATVIPVHSFSKMQKAIADRAFAGEVHGIPVLKYEATMAGEVQNPGLGPLHTEFDGKGNAYTSMFLSSEIVKWSLKDFKVLDRAPTYYSIGHLMIPAETAGSPGASTSLALNKITKDRYLPTGPGADPVGPALRHQRRPDEAPARLPHHRRAALRAGASRPDASRTASSRCTPLKDNKDPYAVKNEKKTRVERKGKVVHVLMTSVRSHFMPDKIEGIQLGDTVYFHLTNLEQDWDVPHGFAITGANNAELLMMPGQTRTMMWVPSGSGSFPSTAPTSARPSTRRCRAMCGSRPGDRRWRCSGTARLQRRKACARGEHAGHERRARAGKVTAHACLVPLDHRCRRLGPAAGAVRDSAVANPAASRRSIPRGLASGSGWTGSPGSSPMT